MPSSLGKNLHMCFIKMIVRDNSPSSHDHHHSRRSSKFVKNFNSLYNDDDDDSDATSTSDSKPLIRNHSSEPDDFDSDPGSEPDFATVVASQRFFFTSPGRSNSIVDQSTTSSSVAAATTTPESSGQSNSNHSSNSSALSCARDSVAVPKYSPDPYMDFRRSMQEMVEARDLVDVKANWDYLHELLLCYLALNPKNTHNFIISAFADLLTSLMSPPETDSVRLREKDHSAGADGCRISDKC